jgi:anti-anti-sigma regulatory factor
MLAISVDNLPDLAVLECKGRIIQSDAVFKLRDFVMARTDPTVVLDLSRVQAIGGAGLGMLVFLEHWAREHNVNLKLFCPSKPIVEGLVHNGSILEFDIASFHEMMALLTGITQTDSAYTMPHTSMATKSLATKSMAA